MTDTRIARRYASAVFKLGMQEGGDATVKRGRVLQDVAALLDAHADLDNVFKSPIFTVDEKKQILGDLLAKIGSDGITRSFCFLLAEKERLSCFRDIVTAYTKLLDEATGVVRGTLTTAVPLSQAKQKSVKAELEARKPGTTLELAFNVDPSILGGVVLKVGDRILDSSLRAQLEILRDTLKRGN